ncbi:hypothetical protein QYB63_001223 [Clostridium perfringens]|nr:hypothetical protein [Clostridium perfringens]
MEQYGYEILETTIYEDMEYKLDIKCITTKGTKVAIQCKSSSFINKNNKIYLQKNIKGQIECMKIRKK